MVGLETKAEGRDETKEILAYLENLSTKEFERLGEPEYWELPKSELWLKALEK